MVRFGVVISGFVLLCVFQLCFGVPPPYGGGGNTKPNGLRGSQVYLQDPWMHEHNYYPKKHNLGPHQHHGWGAAGSGSGSHGGGHSSPVHLPEQATYVQQLYPVFGFSNNLKRLSSALQSLKPGKHWKWQSPAFALFGSDGTPHHVSVAGSSSNDGGHSGQYENDGWSANHGSHHIGHKLPPYTNYNTW